MKFQLEIIPYGDQAILVKWPAEISEIILYDLLNFKKYLLKRNIESIVYINHAYNSLLIKYAFTIDNINDEKIRILDLYQSLEKPNLPKIVQWEIPVCYDPTFGIDLENISLQKELNLSQIIELHSSPIYTVYFIGFLPGFLYLGGMNEILIMERLEKPRLQIRKGGVGIGGSQTGIYPTDSPGGWNIIGNSPIEFFDVSQSFPCFAKPGDKVKFYPVTLQEHVDISQKIKNGTFILKQSYFND